MKTLFKKVVCAAVAAGMVFSFAACTPTTSSESSEVVVKEKFENKTYGGMDFNVNVTNPTAAKTEDMFTELYNNVLQGNAYTFKVRMEGASLAYKNQVNYMDVSGVALYNETVGFVADVTVTQNEFFDATVDEEASMTELIIVREYSIRADAVYGRTGLGDTADKIEYLQDGKYTKYSFEDIISAISGYTEQIRMVISGISAAMDGFTNQDSVAQGIEVLNSIMVYNERKDGTKYSQFSVDGSSTVNGYIKTINDYANKTFAQVIDEILAAMGITSIKAENLPTLFSMFVNPDYTIEQEIDNIIMLVDTMYGSGEEGGESVEGGEEKVVPTLKSLLEMLDVKMPISKLIETVNGLGFGELIPAEFAQNFKTYYELFTFLTTVQDSETTTHQLTVRELFAAMGVDYATLDIAKLLQYKLKDAVNALISSSENPVDIFEILKTVNFNKLSSEVKSEYTDKSISFGVAGEIELAYKLAGVASVSGYSFNLSAAFEIVKAVEIKDESLFEIYVEPELPEESAPIA